MMGRLTHDQGELFYSFRLNDAVSEDHGCDGQAISKEIALAVTSAPPTEPAQPIYTPAYANTGE